MKVCINVGGENQDGYKNVGFVKNLDGIAENGECSEILALDVLSYIHYTNVEQYIQHLCKKVARGGKLILGGLDTIELAKCLLRDDFNVVELNRILFGDGKERPKENTMTLPMVVNVLQASGMKIIKKRINQYAFVVEAHR